MNVPDITRSRAESFEWAEVCLFCNAKIVPPGDGSAGDLWTLHLCGNAPVPWSALEKGGVVGRKGLRKFLATAYKRGERVEGPYPLRELFQPRTMFDLCAWPTENLRRVLHMSDRQREQLEEWLTCYGFTFQRMQKLRLMSGYGVAAQLPLSPSWGIASCATCGQLRLIDSMCGNCGAS